MRPPPGADTPRARSLRAGTLLAPGLLGAGLLAAGLLAALVLAGAGCGPSPEPARGGILDPDSVKLEAGTGGLIRPGAWTRLRVAARAKKGLFQGEVEVRGVTAMGGISEEAVRGRFEASVEEQAIELVFRPEGCLEAVVRFHGPGAPGKSYRVPIESGPESAFRILVVGERPGLGEHLGAMIREQLAPRVPAPDDSLPEILVGSLRPEALPSHWTSYGAADLVILDGTALGSADRERVRALEEWVLRGGVVAASPGPEWTRALPEPVRGLFGLEGPLEERPASRDGAGGAVYEAPPAPAARQTAGGALEIRAGSGRAFLLLSPHRPGPGGAPPRLEGWRNVVEAARAKGPFHRLASRVEAEALRLLVWFSGFRYPPAGAVLLFVLAYLGVGFFLGRAILKRRGKTEWMYAFALVLAAISTVGIWRFGLLAAIREGSLDEVTVAAVRRGSPVADAVTFLGISSPAHGSTAVPLPSGGLPSQPSPEADDYGRPFATAATLPLELRFADGGFAIPSLRLYSNATRLLRVDHPLDLGGRLEGRLVRGQEGAVLEVTNGTRHDLMLFFTREHLWYTVGSVEQGGRGRFPVASLPGGFYGPESNPQLAALRDKFRNVLGAQSLLVAVVETPLYPAGALGPSRNALGFLVAEVEPER